MSYRHGDGRDRDEYGATKWFREHGPRLDYTVSLANLVSVVIGVFLIGVAWASMNSEIKATQAYITSQTELIGSRIDLIEQQIGNEVEANKLRISALSGQVESELRGINRRLDEVINRLEGTYSDERRQ